MCEANRPAESKLGEVDDEAVHSRDF